MNYLEKHPKREPTVKENFKGYLAISSRFPQPYGVAGKPSGEGQATSLRGPPTGSCGQPRLEGWPKAAR